MKAVTVYRHSTVKLSYFCSRGTDLIALLLTTYLLSLNINYIRVEKKSPHMFHLDIRRPRSREGAGKVHADTCANTCITPTSFQTPAEAKQREGPCLVKKSML